MCDVLGFVNVEWCGGEMKGGIDGLAGLGRALLFENLAFNHGLAPV